MKKKILIILITFLFIIQNSFAQTPAKFSTNAVKADFEYLYKTLEASHYDLFVTTPKKTFDKEYQRIMESIKDSLTAFQIYKLFQPFVALSKIRHCTINPPFQEAYGSFIQNGGKLFPVNITIDKSKMYIVDDFSNNPKIKNGDELISINGKSSKSILDDIYFFLPGESDYLKNTMLDASLTFPRMWWILYEPKDSFNIQIKNQKKELINLKIAGIEAGKFEEIQGGKKQIFNAGRNFRFIDDIAYLQPGSFLNANGDGNLMHVQNGDKGEFLKYIDSAFIAIHKAKSKNLIIDLRNNSGGINTFSDEMVAYIANKTFNWCSKFSVKTSEKTKEAFKEINESDYNYLKEMIMNRANGDKFDVEIHKHDYRKDSLKFSGKVYVLVNRYSYSQAPLTAAQIQDYKFGIIVGEKTADNASNIGSSHMFELPNTKILVQYPKGIVIRPNGNAKFEGVTPDIIVEDNLFTEQDEILDYTVNLIKKK